MPHVIGDIEVVVVDPDRPALLVRNGHEAAAEPRQEGQTRQDEVAHVVYPEPAVGGEERCAVEDAHRADVHRVFGPLQVQEARVERGETVVRVHLRAIVGLTLATVYRVDLVPTAVWKISAELVLALDEHLGPPVDSYVNGSQTWLVGDEPNDPDQTGDTAMILEFRLHPVSGYRPPAGCSHYDLWETVVTQLSQGIDAQELRLGNEARSLDGLWDGLEAFPAYGDEIEPARLSAIASAALALTPDRAGLVDHEAIGDAWERANGKVSIVGLLIDQLTS